MQSIDVKGLTRMLGRDACLQSYSLALTFIGHKFEAPLEVVKVCVGQLALQLAAGCHCLQRQARRAYCDSCLQSPSQGKPRQHSVHQTAVDCQSDIAPQQELLANLCQ